MRIKAGLMGKARDPDLTDRNRASGEDVQHGFRGKGVTVHAPADGNGNPLSVISAGAAESGREQTDRLIDRTDVRTGKAGRPEKPPDALQGDRGYDSRGLRDRLGRRGITPMIPRRSWPGRKPPRDRPPDKPEDRWKAESSSARFRRKYRRPAVRRERRKKIPERIYHGCCLSIPDKSTYMIFGIGS